MTSSMFDGYGSDEERAVEGIAALLDLNPPDPGEEHDSVARRMADWGILQGPKVRWEAVWYVAHALLQARADGVRFPQLARVGMRALREYNQQAQEKSTTTD